MQDVYKIDDSNTYYGSEDGINFYPLGGGFVFTLRQGSTAIVRKVEYVPEYIKGYTHFDDSKVVVECIIDKNKFWNGWREPFVTKENLIKLFSELSDPIFDGDTLIVDMCGDTERISPSESGMYHLNQGFTLVFNEKRRL
jgi:hypothetical protein